MSWLDYYQRRDALDTVLREAAPDPSGPLPKAPGDLFTSEQEVLLALQYRWSLVLEGHLRTELLSDDGDAVDAVARAWRAAAAAKPELRAVLAAHLPRHEETLPVRQAEQRMVAVAAGLAEPDDSPEHISRVGLALETLVFAEAAQPATGGCLVGSRLRRLLASA